MGTFKSGILAATAVIALGAFGASDANATAYAYSALSLSNISFSGPAFQTFDFRQDTSASLSPGGSATPGTAQAADTAGTLDAAQAFIGSAAKPAENTFTQIGKSVGDYSRADGLVTSKRIQGDNRGALDQVAETAVGFQGTGQAQAGITKQNWLFSFTAANTGTATLRFHGVLNLIVDLTDTDAQSGTARSTVNATLSGFNSSDNTSSNQSFGFAGGTGLTQSLSGAKGKLRQITPVDSDFSATFDLVAGTDYTFEITTTNNTDVRSVAEPATLASLGLGLLGLGFVARRRKVA